LNWRHSEPAEIGRDDHENSLSRGRVSMALMKHYF
jgi:hypothetical protein